MSLVLAARAGGARVFAAVAGVDGHDDVALAGRRRWQLDRRLRRRDRHRRRGRGRWRGAGGGAAIGGFLSNRSTTRRLPYWAFGARVKLFGVTAFSGRSPPAGRSACAGPSACW
jgi:hypothetical protein